MSPSRSRQVQVPATSPTFLCFYILVKDSTGLTKLVLEHPITSGPFRVPLMMSAGVSAPLGVSQASYGSDTSTGPVNFSIVSERASSMALCLFERSPGGALQPLYELELDPLVNCTGSTWHVTLPNLPLDARTKLAYGWRCTGSLSWTKGSRFNSRRIMLDPYAKWLVRTEDTVAASEAHLLGTWCVTSEGFESDDALDEAFRNVRPASPQGQIIYELDLGGVNTGAFSPLQEAMNAIDHIEAIGATAVLIKGQLTQSFTVPDAATLKGTTIQASLFSPAMELAGPNCTHTPIEEVKNLVNEFHVRGISVIVDVYLSTCVEGGSNSPSMSFKGIDSSRYLRDGPAQKLDFSKTGRGVATPVSTALPGSTATATAGSEKRAPPKNALR
eukprot:scaffold2610_cov301-Prasinococcus_capsulatus_cf.AAC.4